LVSGKKDAINLFQVDPEVPSLPVPEDGIRAVLEAKPGCFWVVKAGKKETSQPEKEQEPPSLSY
jgi:hypothetical protein